MNIAFSIETLGCKVNSYDTGLIQKNLLKEGFSYEQVSPHVIILNTCAVTSEATKEALRWVRKKRRQQPQAKIVLTGCAAQVDTEILTETGADLIIANSHKSSLANIIKNKVYNFTSQRVYKSNIFKKEELEGGGGKEFSHTRSFLKIQDGCNSFCTFCVIPFARGKSRSLPLQELTERVLELYEDGIREVVLTGVHIGDYKEGLEKLVEALLVHTPMPRLRLSSLEPIELTDRLLELFSSEQMCKHFHMSIQSASDSVLKAMKRKYSAQDVTRIFHKIHQKFPEAFVGMDVISGFPSETEEHFLETYKNLKTSPWSFAHVFPYSPRPGTYSSRLKGHQRSEIVMRAKRLRHLSEEKFQKKAQEQIGTSKKVLVLKESSSQKKKMGLSRDYWKVSLGEMFQKTKDKEVSLKITGFDSQSRALF